MQLTTMASPENRRFSLFLFRNNSCFNCMGAFDITSKNKLFLLIVIGHLLSIQNLLFKKWHCVRWHSFHRFLYFLMFVLQVVLCVRGNGADECRKCCSFLSFQRMKRESNPHLTLNERLRSPQWHDTWLNIKVFKNTYDKCVLPSLNLSSENIINVALNLDGHTENLCQ